MSDMSTNVMGYQVGGDHYQRLAPQPARVLESARLPWTLSNVVKYAARAEWHPQWELSIEKALQYLRMYEDGGCQPCWGAEPNVLLAALMSWERQGLPAPLRSAAYAVYTLAHWCEQHVSARQSELRVAREALEAYRQMRRQREAAE